MPDDVVSVYIDAATGKLATPDCPSKKLEVFVRGTEPAEFCSEHGGGEEPAKPLPVQKKEESRSWWSDLKRWWME
ncbi:Penicillin-binding protein 2D [compost metagenome]